VWFAVLCAAVAGATILGMARTVLIVDDHPSFRTSARRVLEADGYHVAGEAHDGRSGIAAARALRPDIVLLDVHLPDLDGFEVAAALTGPDDVPIVVLTSSRDGGDFQRDGRAQRRQRVRRQGRAVWSCARSSAEMIGPRRALMR